MGIWGGENCGVPDRVPPPRHAVESRSPAQERNTETVWHPRGRPRRTASICRESACKVIPQKAHQPRSCRGGEKTRDACCRSALAARLSAHRPPQPTLFSTFEKPHSIGTDAPLRETLSSSLRSLSLYRFPQHIHTRCCLLLNPATHIVHRCNEAGLSPSPTMR